MGVAPFREGVSKLYCYFLAGHFGKLAKRACAVASNAFSYLALVAGCPLPAVQLLIVEVEDDILFELKSCLRRHALDDLFNGFPLIIR